METRTIKIVVLPEGDSIFSERATTIEIVDEAAGEFVKITQEGRYSDSARIIVFDPDEWLVIREAIDRMIAECRNHC